MNHCHNPRNAAITAIVAIASVLLPASCGRQGLDLVVGTYGHNLYEVTFKPDATFGPLKPIPSENPSFVIMDSPGHYFAVSENDPQSGVYSYSESAVTALQSHSDFCPCHLLRIRNMILTADYGKGSVSVFPIEGEVVQPRTQSVFFDGSGPDTLRQTHSHIHQLRVLPSGICRSLNLEGEWILATDLGGDSVYLLSFDEHDKLIDHPQLAISLEPGSGPRHMEFGQAGNMLYCLSELSGEVFAFRISARDSQPVFTLVQSLKADLAQGGGSADIHIHPSGKFLYTSHRLANDGIATFRIASDGTLEMTSYRNTGIHPRNFRITPDGRFLLVACRDSHCIQVFGIDPDDGSLSESPISTLDFGTDQPVCIEFNGHIQS